MKMLASTVQFSTNDQPPPPPPHQTPDNPWQSQQEPGGMRCRRPWRRNPHPTREPPQRPPQGTGPFLQDPTACLRPPPDPDPVPRPPHREPYWGPARSRRPNWSAFHPRAPSRRPAPTPQRSERLVLAWLCTDQNELAGELLLRKEVIQPHLPVRLPCYDFVPIADPAFDGSLHKGWATGFGRYRLS